MAGENVVSVFGESGCEESGDFRRSAPDLWLGRRHFYEARAAKRDSELRRYYCELLKTYYRQLVPPGLRVLELGCGLGDLLAAVRPSHGLGIDFSPGIIHRARHRHPKLRFRVAEALEFVRPIGRCCVDAVIGQAGPVNGAAPVDIEPFDYVLLSDLVNDLYDVQELLEHLRVVAQARTRLVLNFFNHLWRPVLTGAELIGAKAPTPPQNWLSTQDMVNLQHLAGWEIIKTETRILWPMRTPVLATLLNRWLAPLMKHLCLTTIQVARPSPHAR